MPEYPTPHCDPLSRPGTTPRGAGCCPFRKQPQLRARSGPKVFQQANSPILSATALPVPLQGPQPTTGISQKIKSPCEPSDSLDRITRTFAKVGRSSRFTRPHARFASRWCTQPHLRRRAATSLTDWIVQVDDTLDLAIIAAWGSEARDKRAIRRFLKAGTDQNLTPEDITAGCTPIRQQSP